MLSFHLSSDFISEYAERRVNWGFPDVTGNSIGEITYIRTYSRRKDDGSKEQWFETCQRVIEGMYSILKEHCKANRLPWNENKARHSAEEAYERLFTFKWTPPGRGLWMMGTSYVHERGNSAALQNCAFVSTADLDARRPERPFVFLMEASMLGVGVGFDTKGAYKGITIHQESDEKSETFLIPDSREGWVESTGYLIRSFLASSVKSRNPVEFDYSLVRPAGEPIKGFGGTAAGPGPLIELHNHIRAQFAGRYGETLTSRDITDLMNKIGKCVVSGNVRRSAEIALFDVDDKDMLDIKDWGINPGRNSKEGWGWVSNNSVFATVGMDYEPIATRAAKRGEPGLFYLDLVRDYGRMIDPPNKKDYRVVGTNPCGEQSLESYECCTLVETYPTNCTDQKDFNRTLKFAYLYAKCVTLLATHWPETNAVMQRNRRIGTSVSGLALFVEKKGWTELRKWLDGGYHVVGDWDRVYSEWLGVRESIKKTSVKPSGSVSLPAGVTPGVHWAPAGETHLRSMRLNNKEPLVEAMRAAGYRIEPCFGNEETTVVVFIPVRGLPVRSEADVSIYEKAQLAIDAQRYWADNQVSVTLTFDPEREGPILGDVLRMYEGQFKSLSFLPMSYDSYPQMPYTPLTDEEFTKESANILPLNWDALYANGVEGLGEAYCANGTCEVPVALP